MKAAELTEKIADYNRVVAPGSECDAFGDYIADFFRQHETYPDDDRDMSVEQYFADYWIDVADGVSDDYYAATGIRVLS